MWSLGDETKSVSNLYLLDKAEEDAIAAEYVDNVLNALCPIFKK
jgi:hypothetical protein